MILMPMIYVTDMDRSVKFYESLGFEVEIQSRTSRWTELVTGAGAKLALHHADRLAAPSSRIELTLIATEPLGQIQERLRDAVSRPITDEAFGRALTVRDPDGLEIWVNEPDPELYTA